MINKETRMPLLTVIRSIGVDSNGEIRQMRSPKKSRSKKCAVHSIGVDSNGEIRQMRSPKKSRSKKCAAKCNIPQFGLNLHQYSPIWSKFTSIFPNLVQ